MSRPIRLLGLLGSTLALYTLGTAQAAPLDLSQPGDHLQAFRKLLCSVNDAQTVYYVWSGEMYSRVPGEPDRHLFNVQGMSARACATLTSEAGETGFRQVSREVMLYLDPETNELLEQWQNPWTGAITSVVPVANDPVNSQPFWPGAVSRSVVFQRFEGTDTVFLSLVLPLFYPSPLAGSYQDYVGGYYHAMEMFNFSADADVLLGDGETDVEQVAVSWSRVSPWLPWMQMGSRPGELVVQAASTRIGSWEQLPEPLRSQVASEYALFQSPPPLDDQRPNETTWTNFLQYLEQQPD